MLKIFNDLELFFKDCYIRIGVWKGYKIYNHECYYVFIKEILKLSVKADEFDELKIVNH